MRKLYKLQSEKKVSGVCAGLADYFELDVSIIRVIFLIFILTWGTGLVLYIALAFILPDKTELEDENVKEAEYKEKTTDEDVAKESKSKEEKNGSIFDE